MSSDMPSADAQAAQLVMEATQTARDVALALLPCLDERGSFRPQCKVHQGLRVEQQ